MNDLKIFNYGKTPVRTVLINEEPWFVAADVCNILEYSNSRKAIADHVDEEDKGVTKCYTPGGEQNVTIINESGLYSLILSSKQPEARRFKRWVTSEVLPQIRQTGNYVTMPDGELPDKKWKIARLIASCGSEAAVNGILALYGFPIIESHPTPAPAPVAMPGDKKDAPDSVVEYLKTVERWELTNTPSKSVYQDYVSFCKDSGFPPVCLTGFSRTIHRLTNLIVQRRRVEGIRIGFYA